MLTVAVEWKVCRRTGSALALGFVGLTQMAPIVLLILPAGHVADHHNRKITILATVSFCCTALASADGDSFARACPVNLLFVSDRSQNGAHLFWPADEPSPQLLNTKVFPGGITWNTGAFHLSSVIGPAVGGALIALTHNAAVISPMISPVAFLICLRVGCADPTGASAPGLELEMTLKLLADSIALQNENHYRGLPHAQYFCSVARWATSLLPVMPKTFCTSNRQGLGLLADPLVPIGLISCAAYFVIGHRFKSRTRPHHLRCAFQLGSIHYGISKWFWLSSLRCWSFAASVDNVNIVIRHTLMQLAHARFHARTCFRGEQFIYRHLQ